MKKLVVVLLIALMMLSSTALVFAEETTQDIRGERTERTERTREDQRGKVIELFEQYNPAGLESFNAINGEHKSFHEMVRAEKELIKAEFQAAREALKELAESGELTREEIKEIYASYKAEREAFRAEAEGLKVAKQVAVEANKAELKSVREALKAALQSEVVDGAYVSGLLNQMVDLLEEHVGIDVYYYDQIHALKANSEDEIL